MRGEAVPYHVGGQVVKNSSLPPQRGKELPERLARHPPASRRDEQVRARAPSEQLSAGPVKIAMERPEGRSADWRHPLLVSFSDDPQDSGLELDIGQPEPTQLRDTKPGGV